MSDEKNDDFDRLMELVDAKRRSASEASNYLSLIQPLQVAQQLDDHAKRMAAVQDAHWKTKCPEYEPPSDDDVGSNFINCSITSDKALEQLAGILSDKDVTVPGDGDKPTNGKWWKWLFGTLLGVMLGALIVFLAWNQFGDIGGARYEIIAKPYKPNT